MYEERIQYAIDNFVLEDYFLKMNSDYILKETEDSGKSELKITVEGTNICVENYDKKKRCNFFRSSGIQGLHKCIDHFILRIKNNKWELHMIEMKSSVGHATWRAIKQKVRASYLNIHALVKTLGLELDDAEIYVYTTYENDCFCDASPDPKTLIPLLGKKAIDNKKDEWDAGKIGIKFAESIRLEFSHSGIKMNRSKDGTTLQAALSI